ncbi:HD-GYP domain-containing protein [Phycicoccus duodecadis]|uniref:HD/PDEase domain-containing protein n=1 Tax=Phycicoccus duodecadis TaxID=173053 RepID=A0A2N3YGV8_9MICO|nr:HD domain-containing phosphohydrolase [Phycicoccus duodecadis]PKW26078.1 hypothetical protein ATL31_0883 [Phycicoccus duodecadis]
MTTAIYIAAVVLLAVSLLVVGVLTAGPSLGGDLAVFLVLAVFVVLIGDVVVEGRTRLSLSNVLLLGGQVLVGPFGAGILGAVLGVLQHRKVPVRARVFNAAQAACYATLGGLAFLAVGGSHDPGALRDVHDVLRHLALPILVADVCQVVVNVLLLAGVVRVSTGVSLRTEVNQLLTSVGLLNLGYGVIAFLLALLWIPAGMGAAAVVLVVAPLLVAQWAYRQHAEELRGQERALQVLVAALEAKAPHLTGHSARVADLSASMAEALGLRPQVIGDTRLAGMLHDVGQTSLPTAVVRSVASTSAALDDYPRRSAGILGGLSFLDGALAPIADHRVALDTRLAPATLPGGIVGLADAYDLLTEVGGLDGAVLGSAEARERLRALPGVDDDLLRALSTALLRPSSSTER